MKKINWILLFLFWILLGGILIKFGPQDFVNQYILWSNGNNELSYFQNKYERFELIDMILNQSYYDEEKIVYNDMLKNAIKSYVDGINDPYTVYMDSEENSWFIHDLEWQEEFEGIWAVVNKKDYYVQIEEVLKNSPAFKAWIQPLDRIIKIEDKYVEDETLDEAVSRMKWPAWTKVIIIIERLLKDDKKEIIEKIITREKINVPSVNSEIINVNEKKIWYIELFIIWEESENLFKKEVKQLKEDWVEGIILDLRWNWGGLMPIAVEIVSHFIEKWKLVVSAKYKWYEDEKLYSKWFGEFEWLKTVVLIDSMTASAWEIIAMALQEQIWAELIGTTTFGKWTIQTLDEFDNGDSLKYTIWKWFAPSNKNIDGIWVVPDITVEFDADSYLNNNIDNQLEEAKNMFK